MTCLGSQLIRPVALIVYQNENGVILVFMSKECVHIIYLTYALFVNLGQIRSNCLLGFGLLTYFLVGLGLGLYWIMFNLVILIGFHT